jgi:hypothetical protein
VKLVHLVGFIIKKSDTMHGDVNVKLNVIVTGMQQHLLYNGQSEPDPLPVPVFTQVFLGHLQLRAVQQPEACQCH